MNIASPVIPNEEHDEIIFAEKQDEYENLPAIPLEGGFLTAWTLSDEEMEILKETKRIYVYILGAQVQPLRLQVEKPELVYAESHEFNAEAEDSLALER